LKGSFSAEHDVGHDGIVRGDPEVVWQDSLHAYEISYYLFKQGLDVTLSGRFKILSGEI